MPIKEEHTFGDKDLLKKYLEALPKKSSMKLIFQPSDASGDISHVVAALVLDPRFKVLVIGGSGVANAYVDSYKIDSDRIYLLTEKYEQKAFADFWSGLKLPFKHGLPDATKAVRDAIKNAKVEGERKSIRKTLREAMRGGKEGINEAGFEQFIKEKNISCEKDLIVLWGRRSGKERAQHANLDSSSIGLYTLANRCADSGWNVVFAGDLNVTKGWEGREGFKFLGKFWDDEAWAHNELGRSGQVRLFYILKKKLNANGKGLVHVGMRSGGLDAYAFAQQHTIYLIPKSEAPRDERVNNLVIDMGKLYADRDTKSFARVALEQPPKARYQVPHVVQSQQDLAHGNDGAPQNRTKQEIFEQRQKDFEKEKIAFGSAMISHKLEDKIKHLDPSTSEYKLHMGRGFCASDLVVLKETIEKMLVAQAKRIEQKAEKNVK